MILEVLGLDYSVILYKHIIILLKRLVKTTFPYTQSKGFLNENLSASFYSLHRKKDYLFQFYRKMWNAV